MAGNFRRVLIFVIFVVDSAITKITTHEINDTWKVHERKRQGLGWAWPAT